MHRDFNAIEDHNNLFTPLKGLKVDKENDL